MFYVLSWLLVLSLLALWSLGVWAVQAVAVWTLSQAGSIGAIGGSTPALEGLALPAWLAPWVPSELLQAIPAMLAGIGPLVDGLLQAVPALAGGLTVIAWVVWGLGAVLLLVLGLALHGLIAVWRRRSGHGGPPSGRPLSAA